MATKRQFNSTEEFIEFNQNLCEVIRSLSFKKEMLQEDEEHYIKTMNDNWNEYLHDDENQEYANYEEYYQKCDTWEVRNARNEIANKKLQIKIYDELINYLMEVK